MKFARVLIPVVLFLVAAPSFALCGWCDFNCSCVPERGLGSGCRFNIDCCYDVSNPSCLQAATAAPVTLAAEYKIASVEVVTPATRTLDTNAPRVADARTPRSNTR